MNNIDWKAFENNMSLMLINMKLESLLASGENNLHKSGEINQKKSKEKSHYQF